jgi:hypothetical protein
VTKLEDLRWGSGGICLGFVAGNSDRGNLRAVREATEDEPRIIELRATMFRRSTAYGTNGTHYRIRSSACSALHTWNA